MGIPKQEHYLLTKRDEAEKNRLNQQNTTANAVRGGHTLDPAIPKHEITRIADIATGTGVFMHDVMSELATAKNTSLEVVGFDISPALFPEEPLPGTKFVVWDMTQDFPKEYHNSFDLVHLQFAHFALAIEKIQDFVENLLRLIKPGGYLQWTDYTFRHGSESMYPDGPEGLSSLAEGRLIFTFMFEQNWAVHLPGLVEHYLRRLATTDDVCVTDFTDAPFRRPEIRDLLTDWHALTVPTILHMMMRRKGVAPDEIASTIVEYRAKALEMGRRGQVFQMPICTLTARKKSSVL